MATDGAPVKRVTEVSETQLYQLRGGRVTVTDISQSTATVDVKV